MAEFWKTIDSSYFPILSGGRPTESKKDILSLFKGKIRRRNEFVVTTGHRFVDSAFNKGAFKISDNSSVNRLNQENFVLGLYINKVIYGGFMKLMENGIEPCEDCFSKFEGLYKERFNFKVRKTRRTCNLEKNAKSENKQLAKVYSKYDISLCDGCLRRVYGYIKIAGFNSQLSQQRKSLETVQKRSSNLFKTMFKRINSNKQIQITINVSLEAEILRKYLLTYLLELEQKLIIDNIYNVIGKSKKTIYIEFIRLNGVYMVDLNELKLWNRYREGSVFRIHKCAYKRYNPYYSFNVV